MTIASRSPGLAGLKRLLRAYGRVHAEYTDTNRGHAMRAKIQARLVGSFSATTMAQLLGAVYAVLPPSLVLIRTKRRNWTQRHGVTVRVNGVRPSVDIEWSGDRAVRLAVLLGWRTGKPTMDAKLRAWKRWLTYRKAAGTYWRDGQSRRH